MAEIMDEFAFRSGHHLGRAAFYPWNLWTDGRVWKATRGIDFNCCGRNFRSQLYVHSKLKGRKVRSTVDNDHDTVTFQFYDKPTN